MPPSTESTGLFTRCLLVLVWFSSLQSAARSGVREGGLTSRFAEQAG